MADIERTVIKLAMLGDSSVGKTSICNVFLNLEFEQKLLSTIGQDKMECNMIMDDGKEKKLVIWDTAGQERFHSIAIKACRKAQGIIIVFDLGNRSSFLNVVNWLKEIRDNFNNISLILFGNKCDLAEREVTKEEAEKFAEENNLVYLETSAKAKININEGFKLIANDAYKKYSKLKDKDGIYLKAQKGKNKNNCCGGDKKK